MAKKQNFYGRIALVPAPWALFNMISERTWPAKSVYAALLYPEHFDRIARFFNQHLPKSKDTQRPNFLNLTRRVKDVSKAFIRDIGWDSMDLAGFSVCFAS